MRYRWLGTFSKAGETPALYHWSPAERRQSILRRGVRVGRLSVDGDWRPPYSCWAEDPLWAWKLSGELRPEVAVWDLWWCWLGSGWKVRRLAHWGDATRANNPARWSEWRIYEDLPKSAVKWVASRPGGLTIHRNPSSDWPRP